jgi:hypothetical protein
MSVSDGLFIIFFDSPTSLDRKEKERKRSKVMRPSFIPIFINKILFKNEIKQKYRTSSFPSTNLVLIKSVAN